MQREKRPENMSFFAIARVIRRPFLFDSFTSFGDRSGQRDECSPFGGPGGETVV